MNANEREQLQQALSLFERGMYHLQQLILVDVSLNNSEMANSVDKLHELMTSLSNRGALSQAKPRRTQNSWEAPLYSGLDVGMAKSQSLLDEIRILPTDAQERIKQRERIRRWRVAAEKEWKAKHGRKSQKSKTHSQKKGRKR